MAGLPLGPGAAGESVRDLHRRLARLGIDVGAEHEYGPATTEAVRTFQERRGLLADGICDKATWSALVEANYSLGDRLLYLRAPMLRGDDVAELQRQLGSLGFDAGRVDGIFGPMTELALKDFQRNAGLTTDGVCGRDVVATLRRLGSKAGTTETVAGVRERQRLRDRPRATSGQRVVVGNLGGLGSVASAVERHLHAAGAIVAVLHHPDPSVQAAEANLFEAGVYVGLALVDEAAPRLAYYAAPGFESAGGRRLAEQLAVALASALELGISPPAGMRLPVLRETRMPAVMAHLAPAERVVAATAAVAAAVNQALTSWFDAPVEA